MVDIILIYDMERALTLPVIILGPCIGMDCLHGVLMHNDEKDGDNHALEDKVKREEDSAADTGQKGPGKGGDSGLHGVLMHGDETPDKEHSHNKFGPVEKSRKEGPGLNKDEQIDGIINNQETEEDNSNHKKGHHAEPCFDQDCDTFKDKNEDNDSESGNKVRKVQNAKKHVSKTFDPDSLLHGSGHDHHSDEHNTKMKKNTAVKFISSVQDPHHIIHNEEVGKVPEIDKKDYEEWKTKEKAKEKEEEKGILQRFSLGFISDSFLSDIEALKRRYLPKYWTQDTVTKDKRENKETGKTNDKVDHMQEDMMLVGGTHQLKKQSTHEIPKKVHDEE
ncbi:DgyrCDS805 [Dimorphilus gyrociliatus]|uniref:DgyrCDS805 n=1 Tax=Dimorphilus gyrociliatus TaxID=2664684 RepID=A0A7I8V899_9ANNE|nr:DgyrCDS805 [Dimorphilus gyrociliatus]